MQLRRKYTKTIIIAICLLAMQVSFADIGINTAQKIQEVINAFRIKHNIPGAEVSFNMPNTSISVDFVSGTTTLNGTNKVTPNHLFMFGSDTKSFTVAVILQLEQEGKLNINDPIGKYLPEYPQWSKITIKQLLNMTSGIYDYLYDLSFATTVLANPGKIWTPQELLYYASIHDPYFKPGNGWAYCNTNYILAGMIIEKVTHHFYTDELHKRFLDAKDLNLPNILFYKGNVYTDDVMRRLVHGYNSIFEVQDVTCPNISWAWSAGGIIGNTHDFWRWPQLLLQTNKIIDSKRLEEIESLVCNDDKKCILGTTVSKEIGGYGLGLNEANVKPFGYIWSHSGATLGYRTTFFYIPKYNFAIAIALNMTNFRIFSDIHALAWEIIKILYASEEWQRYRLVQNIPLKENFNEEESYKAFAELFRSDEL